MSYKLTEAERKHFAAIEDTLMYLVKNPVEGATDSITLKIEDGDKLNLGVTLPSYKFAVTSEDDKYARIRLIADDGNEIICEGVNGYDNPTKENRGLGIGWRYTISFTKDEDGYVNAIKLVRKNDGATKILSFSKLSKLTIKELTVDNESTFKDNVTISKSHEEEKDILDEEGNVIGTETVTVQDDITLDVKGLVKADKAEIADSKVANLEVKDSTIKNLTVTDRLAIGEPGEEVEKNAEVLVANTIVDVTGSTIKTDETTDIILAKADIADAVIANEKVTASEIEAASILKAEVSIADIKNASIKRIDGDEIYSNHEHTVNLCVKDKVDEEGNVTKALADIDTEKVGTSTIENLTVTKETITDLTVSNLEATKATIGEEVVQKSEITEATIENLDAEKISAGDIEFANTITDNFGTVASSTGDILELGNSEEELVLVSKGHGDLNDDNHYRIKAVVDGKETYVMTANDAKELGLDNIVDRTSNQNIRGQKKFYDKLSIGNGILGIDQVDDKEAFYNVIVRGPDTNHPESVSPWTPNPELDDAADEGKAYENSRALYNEFSNAVRNGNVSLSKYYKTSDNLKATSDSLDYEKAYNERLSIFESQLSSGLETVSAGHVADLAKAEDGYNKAVDNYNQHMGYTEESELFLKKDEEGKYPDARVDEIYEAAEKAAISNDNAVQWLTRANSALSNNNIKAVVDAISNLGLDMFFDTSYKSIKTIDDFFYFGDKWQSTNNPVMTIFDTFIKAVAKDPSLKSCPDYDAYSAKAGVYKDGDLSHQLVVKNAPYIGNITLHIDGYSYTAENDAQIFDFISGEESSNPITSYEQLSKAYKNAEKSKYLIEQPIEDLKATKDNYNSILSHGVVGDIIISMARPEDELGIKAFGKVASQFNLNVTENVAEKKYDVTTALIVDENAKSCVEASNAKIAELEAAVAELTEALALAKADSQTCVDTYNEKAQAYLTDEYVAANCPQKKEFNVVDFDELTANRKTLDGSVVTAPVKTEKVERLIAGNIDSNVPNPEAQTVINIGNTHDAIAFEAAPFEYFPEGADKTDETQKVIDEHMLATVNGHLHKIAYVDDVIAVDNTALDGMALKFSVTGNEEANEATVSKSKVVKSIFTEAEIETGKGVPEIVDSNEEVFKVKGTNGIDVKTEGSDIIVSTNMKVDVDTAGVANGVKLTICDKELEIASEKGTLTIDATDSTKVNVEANTYTGDDYKAFDIVSAYNSLSETEGNQAYIAKAVDVKAMTDKVEKIAIDARSALDIRVPAAPRQTGSYVLNASVFADAPDADGNIKMTSKYHWNGAMALPETSNELGACDDMGKPLEISTTENPVEYGLKLRLIEEVITYDDGSTQKKVIPTLCWSKIR